MLAGNVGVDGQLVSQPVRWAHVGAAGPCGAPVWALLDGLGRSGGQGVEGGDPQEVVDRGGDLEPGSVALAASVAECRPPPMVLIQPKGFLDAFADPHRHVVTGVAGGALVDR